MQYLAKQFQLTAYLLYKSLHQPLWYLCVSVFHFMCDAHEDAHSMLFQLTDGWHEQMFGMWTVLLFVSHMWGVENRPICAYRSVSTHMQHLMPHWILRVRAFVWSTCREASDTEISLTGYRHLTYNYLMLISFNKNIHCVHLWSYCEFRFLLWLVCFFTYWSRKWINTALQF